MEDNLSRLPTISIRFKLPGIPCKYNTQNSELLICGANVRCPKGFFDIGNEMCQPISDVKANGIATNRDTTSVDGFYLPNITIADMFLAIFAAFILGAVIITSLRYLFSIIFNSDDNI